MEETSGKQNNKIFLWAIGICLFGGAFGSFIVSRDTSGYVASMTYYLLVLFCGFPIVLLLFISAIVAAVKDKAKVTVALLLSCVMLPVFFFSSMKIMEAVGIAKYKHSGSDEMRPIGSELNERIVIAFNENASQEETRKFDETILRKTIPQPNGILLDFADGICGIMYPETEFKYEIADVGFCNDATDEQKRKIRNSVNSSNIVFKVFENLKMEDIKKLPLKKKKIKVEPSAESIKKQVVNAQ